MKTKIKVQIEQEVEIEFPFYCKSGESHYYRIINENEGLCVRSSQWSFDISFRDATIGVALHDGYEKITREEFETFFNQTLNKIKVL
jgi:hypothetical protein